MSHFYPTVLSSVLDRMFGPERHTIPHAILLDLPSLEIWFGIAVGGDAQFLLECVTTAVAGRIGRFGAVWRQLLRSDPLKLPDPMKFTDQLRSWTLGMGQRQRQLEENADHRPVVCVQLSGDGVISGRDIAEHLTLRSHAENKHAPFVPNTHNLRGSRSAARQKA